MFFSGFADEGAPDLAGQIEITKELGWNHIDLRDINGKSLGQMSAAEFEAAAEALLRAGITVKCLGTPIANWQRPPRSEEAFQKDLDELRTTLRRMQLLNIPMLRGMSYLPAPDETPDSPELEKIIFEKLRTMTAMCEEAGVIYAHENCQNYGGMSFEHTLKMLDNVNSRFFRLIFDTGNPVFNYRRIGAAPYPAQSSWEFYRQVREYVVHVHIKDAVSVLSPEGWLKPEFCFAGDGEGDVRAVVIDLIKRGYNGGYAMEPHLPPEWQPADRRDDAAAAALRKKETYIAYCREFEKLYAECSTRAGVNS